MANSTSSFRALYNFGGGSSVNRSYSYGIASSEDWTVGSVVAWNSSGVLLDPTTSAADVLGISTDIVVSGAATGPVTDRCGVIPFQYGTVYAVQDPTDTSQVPVAADIGSDTELDLVSTVWGIDFNGDSTSATPQFRIVDIDTTRLEWHVVIETVGIATVYQWHDAPV